MPYDDSDASFEERRANSRGEDPTRLVWEELRYIRKKVDALETKILYLFGTASAITLAIAVFELLSHKP